MKRTVAKVTYNGVYKVIYDDSRKYNKYVIVSEYYGADNYKHSRTVIAYADFKSAMYDIYAMI